MKKLSCDKRGGSIDQIWFIVMCFALVIGVITVNVVWKDVLSTDSIFDETIVGQHIESRTTNSFASMDNALLIIYVFVHIGILFLAFLQRTHPVFFFISLILSIVMIILAAPLANAYDDIMDDDFYANTITDYPKINFIWSHIVEFEVVWFFITAIMTYGISKYEDSGGMGYG